MGAQELRSNVHNLNFLSLQPCEGQILKGPNSDPGRRGSKRYASLMVADRDYIRRAARSVQNVQVQAHTREELRMLAKLNIWKNSVAILATGICVTLVTASPAPNRRCRYLPEDPEWPSDQDWATLNRTTGGNLIRGVPLAQTPCYGITASQAACSKLQDDWMLLEQL
jgi:hypothetical protein